MSDALSPGLLIADRDGGLYAISRERLEQYRLPTEQAAQLRSESEVQGHGWSTDLSLNAADIYYLLVKAPAAPFGQTTGGTAWSAFSGETKGKK